MSQSTMLVKAETLCETPKDRMLQRKLWIQCSHSISGYHQQQSCSTGLAQLQEAECALWCFVLSSLACKQEHPEQQSTA